MFKIGDRVRIMGTKTVAKIDNIIDNTALLVYPDGDKTKIKVNYLVPVKDTQILLTPEKFDNAVLSLMYDTAENAAEGGKAGEIDDILRVIGFISGQLKERLFDSND